MGRQMLALLFLLLAVSLSASAEENMTTPQRPFGAAATRHLGVDWRSLVSPSRLKPSSSSATSPSSNEDGDWIVEEYHARHVIGRDGATETIPSFEIEDIPHDDPHRHLHQQSTLPEDAPTMMISYTSRRHKKWHFVSLEDAFPGDDPLLHSLDKRMSCDEAHVGQEFSVHLNQTMSTDPEQEQRHFLSSPPPPPLHVLKFLLNASRQNFAHTVLVAHHSVHCGGKPIFRRLHAARHSVTTLGTGGNGAAETDGEKVHNYRHTVHMKTSPLLPQDVYHTMTVDVVVDQMAAEERRYESKDDGAALIKAAKKAAAEEKRRGMVQQSTGGSDSWWKEQDSAPLRAVAKSAEQPTDMMAKMKEEEEAPTALAPLPNWNVDGTYKMNNVNYNGDVTGTFKTWDIAAADNLAASMTFNGVIKFKLTISNWKVTSLKMFWEGILKQGVRGEFDLTWDKDNPAYQKPSSVAVTPISFTLNNAPATINPEILVSTGYDNSVDGLFAYKVLFSGQGYVRQGLEFTSAGGYNPIAITNIDYVYDVSPREYRAGIGLNIFVNSVMKIDVSFFGGPRSGVRFTGELLISKTEECGSLLQLHMMPIQAAASYIVIDLGSTSVVNQLTTPNVIDMVKKPLFNLCIPSASSTAAGGGGSRRQQHQQIALSQYQAEIASRAFAEQADETIAPTPAPQGGVNLVPIVTTPISFLNMNDTGYLWYGTVESNGCNWQQKVSVQFVPGFDPGETLVLVVLTSNYSYPGKEDRLQVRQVAYSVYDQLRRGFAKDLEYFSNDTNFERSSTPANPLSTGLPPKNIRAAIRTQDGRLMTLVSSQLICGSMSLKGAMRTNDNLTFNLFIKGASTPATLFERLKSLIKWVLTFVPSIGIVAIATLVSVIICFVKGRRRRRFYLDIAIQRHMNGVEGSPSMKRRMLIQRGTSGLRERDLMEAGDSEQNNARRRANLSVTSTTTVAHPSEKGSARGVVEDHVGDKELQPMRVKKDTEKTPPSSEQRLQPAEDDDPLGLMAGGISTTWIANSGKTNGTTTAGSTNNGTASAKPVDAGQGDAARVNSKSPIPGPNEVTDDYFNDLPPEPMLPTNTNQRRTRAPTAIRKAGETELWDTL